MRILNHRLSLNEEKMFMNNNPFSQQLIGFIIDSVLTIGFVLLSLHYPDTAWAEYTITAIYALALYGLLMLNSLYQRLLASPPPVLLSENATFIFAGSRVVDWPFGPTALPYTVGHIITTSAVLLAAHNAHWITTFWIIVVCAVVNQVNIYNRARLTLMELNHGRRLY